MFLDEFGKTINIRGRFNPSSSSRGRIGVVSSGKHGGSFSAKMTARRSIMATRPTTSWIMIRVPKALREKIMQMTNEYLGT